ncbi:MAG: carboxylesterase family protein, partial [Gammaproteobacteria bacterium]
MNRGRIITVAALAVLYLGAAIPVSAKHIDRTLVKTRYGAVRGYVVEDFNTLAWKGIPYAEPPVGKRRWKAPENPRPWQGVLDATEYGSRCVQPRGNGHEDCLYLNIWRPKNKKRELPVFVYIHGGSNTAGSGEGPWYTVAHHYDAVVVSINYRLGAMGWFLHPALMTANKNDDSGNFGTLDQIQALRWIRNNIGRFGGNPRNVTIAGASAGAQNVSYLMHTRLAKRLFRKAILESNFPGIRPVSAAFKSSKQVLYNLLVSDGTVQDTAAAKRLVETSMTDDLIADYFYAKTPQEITDAYRNAYWGRINWGDFFRDDINSGSTSMPPPVVQASEDRPEFVYAIGDGYVLPDDIDFADFSAGRVFPKPMIVGTTKNENNFWNADWPFNFQQDKSLNELVTEAVGNSNPDYEYLADFYALFGEGDADTFKENYRFATELIDEVDTYLGAQLSARNLARAYRRGRVPIYVYRFDWGSDPGKRYNIPSEDAWVFYKGAVHVAESDFFY